MTHPIKNTMTIPPQKPVESPLHQPPRAVNSPAAWSGKRASKDFPDRDLSFRQILGFLILHAPLMLVFTAVPFLATLYALLILAVGLVFLLRDERPTRLAWVIGYLAGAEILWRGVDGAPVWEYGKYASLLLGLLVLIKFGLLKDAVSWPVLFVALLVPGILIMPGFDRQAISFQLGGLVTLAVLSMAFSTMQFNKPGLQRLLLAVMAPVVAMAFLTLYLGSTQQIHFSGGGANEEITGGIGANQVTSALSLGATAAFFYIFIAGKEIRVRNLMILMTVGLTVVSVLTFSRAGLWNTVGALLAGAFFLTRDRWRSGTLFYSLAIMGLLAYAVIFPLLNNVTGGTLLTRYSDFDSTGRDILARIDYQIFLENPVFGVGVWQSVPRHIPYFGYPKRTHTEYTRLLAEHGSLGAAAIAILAAVTLQRAFGNRRAFSKGFSVAFTIWALLYFLHAATRMVAPSFTFALAAACFLPEEEQTDTPLKDEKPSHSRYHRR